MTVVIVVVLKMVVFKAKAAAVGVAQAESSTIVVEELKNTHGSTEVEMNLGSRAKKLRF